MRELVNLVNMYSFFLHKEKRKEKRKRDKKNRLYKYAMFTHKHNILILLYLSCEHRCEHIIPQVHKFTITDGFSPALDSHVET